MIMIFTVVNLLSIGILLRLIEVFREICRISVDIWDPPLFCGKNKWPLLISVHHWLFLVCLYMRNFKLKRLIRRGKHLALSLGLTCMCSYRDWLHGWARIVVSQQWNQSHLWILKNMKLPHLAETVELGNLHSTHGCGLCMKGNSFLLSISMASSNGIGSVWLVWMNAATSHLPLELGVDAEE